jgi:hypothetical protein
MIVAAGEPAFAQTAVKATIAPGAKPVWEKGITGINAESYYQAIECGKQTGTPACVFWDTDLCKNPDFELAMYTPYKSVAYEVWRVVRQGKPAPQPNYAAAQATRITVGITPVRGSKNTLTGFALKRAGKAVMPIDGGLSSSQFTFDFPAFAPTAAVTLEMVGKTGSVSCSIDTATLRRMR